MFISGQSSYHCADKKTWNLELRHQKAILVKYLEFSFVTRVHKTAGSAQPLYKAVPPW